MAYSGRIGLGIKAAVNRTGAKHGEMLARSRFDEIGSFDCCNENITPQTASDVSILKYSPA